MALDLHELQLLQRKLQDRYAGWWEAVDPEHGKNKLLWMLAEMGEVIQIVKKNKTEDLLEPNETRHALVEELADVLMFFNDVLLCYGITHEEFETVYREKHEQNLTRWKKPGE